MAKKITAFDRRRHARRDDLWSKAAESIYDKRNEAGFCTIPRSLALVATLIRHLSKRDPSRAYWDLWTRQRDDGYVEIEDAAEMAAISGLTGTRALKSWREKLDELERLGFIQIKGKGNQKYKYVLLLHPHDVVQKIRHENPDRIPDWWWSYFTTRIQDIGAKLRWEPPKPVAKNGAGDDFDDFPKALTDDNDMPF